VVPSRLTGGGGGGGEDEHWVNGWAAGGEGANRNAVRSSTRLLRCPSFSHAPR
jgi:hypothetical protein